MSSSRIGNKNQEAPDLRKVIIIVLLVSIAVFAIILVSMTLTKPAHDGAPKTLSFALYQSVTYSYNGTNYEFKYEPAGQTNLLIIASEGQSLNYPAVAGVTHEDWGLKILIVSATQELIVVQVTPTENGAT
jgi:hypothetical protein